jgi:hypothetical protein
VKKVAEEVVLVATGDEPVPASDVLLTAVAGESAFDKGVMVVVTTTVPVTKEEMVVALVLWKMEDAAKEVSGPG